MSGNLKGSDIINKDRFTCRDFIEAVNAMEELLNEYVNRRKEEVKGVNNNIKVYEGVKPIITQGSIDRLSNKLKGNSMTNEKLMKIVQAVNSSKGEACGVSGDIYEVSIGFGSSRRICTVEEFNQCVKEMSAGYSKKESDMKDNRHPHAHLIDEWCMNIKTRFQSGIGDEPSWSGCGVKSLIADIEGEIKFRIKPREFVKGHWYPCVYEDGGVYVKKYNGSSFFSNGDYSSISFRESEFSDIGESLGEIKFK